MINHFINFIKNFFNEKETPKNKKEEYLQQLSHIEKMGEHFTFYTRNLDLIKLKQYTLNEEEIRFLRNYIDDMRRIINIDKKELEIIQKKENKEEYITLVLILCILLSGIFLFSTLLR